MNKVKYGLLAFSFGLISLYPTIVYAVIPAVQQTIDFGSYIKTQKLNTSSFVSIDTNGAIKFSSDLKRNTSATSTPKEGIIRYSELNNFFLNWLDFTATPTETPQYITSNIIIDPPRKLTTFVTTPKDIKFGLTINPLATGTINGHIAVTATNSEDPANPIVTQLPFTITINNPPINFTQTTGLNFGTLIAKNNPFDLTIDTAGTISRGSQMIVQRGANLQKAGEFTIEGLADTPIQITLPDNIQLSNGTDKMMVDTLTGSLNGGPLNGILGEGVSILKVGGTLHVNANQQPGIYNGNYSINITY